MYINILYYAYDILDVPGYFVHTFAALFFPDVSLSTADMHAKLVFYSPPTPKGDPFAEDTPAGEKITEKIKKKKKKTAPEQIYERCNRINTQTHARTYIYFIII